MDVDAFLWAVASCETRAQHQKLREELTEAWLRRQVEDPKRYYLSIILGWVDARMSAQEEPTLSSFYSMLVSDGMRILDRFHWK